MHEELKIDTENLRSVALNYDIVFGKPGNPKPTRRGDKVRAAASELDRLYEKGKQDAETIAKLRKAIEDAPHENNCVVMTGSEGDVRQFGCTCKWKKDALA